MTKYVITGPDGTKYNVSGDGTPEEALAAFQEHLAGGAKQPAAPTVSPPPPEQSTWGAVKQGAGDLAQGAKASLDRTALGLKGLLPQAVQDWGDRMDKSLGSGGLTKETATQVPNTTMGTIGDVGGEIAQALVPGGAALKAANVAKKGLALTRAARLAVPAAALTDIAGNAGAAAAMAPEERGTAAMWGAGGTVAGQAAGRVLGGVLRPSVSPEAQKLIDAGVQLTPGQALSGPQAGVVARTLRATEDKATSIPILGDVLQNAQAKSVKSFNTNKINEAIGNFGKVEEPGINGLKQADDLISNAYDAVLPHIKVDSGKGLQAAIDARTAAMQNPLFDVAHENKFDMFVDRRITPLLAGTNTVDGAVAKKLDAELGELGRKYSNAGVGNEPLGEAFFALRKEWRAAMEGSTPEARQVLKDADKAYAKLLPLQQAGEKNTAGIFTPKQLADQLRKLHMQDDPLTQAARQVLPNTIPDTGTAGRALLGQMLHPAGLGAGTAAAAGATGFVAPAVAALGASALYTKAGLKGATQGIHPLVKALRGRGRPYDPNVVEDVIRNVTGRGVSAVANQE